MYYKEENDLFTREGPARYYDLKAIVSHEITFVGIQAFRAKRDFLYRKHCHEIYEIIFPKDREYRCLLNGQELSVLPGEFLVVQVGDWHQDIMQTGTEFTVISFAISNPANANAPWKLFKDKTMAVNRKMAIPQDQLFTTLFTLLREPGGGQDEAVDYCILGGIFSALFWKIILLFPERHLSPMSVKNLSKDTDRQRLRRLFEENLHGKLNLAQIAGHMNMSQSKLTHACREIIGTSPAKAFTRYKLQRAEAHLRDSRRPIKQIASQLGFSDQFHFSRTFKRFYGISPHAYRKKHCPAHDTRINMPE
jgi:AraC-like DNA-binding protein